MAPTLAAPRAGAPPGRAADGPDAGRDRDRRGEQRKARRASLRRWRVRFRLGALERDEGGWRLGDLGCRRKRRRFDLGFDLLDLEFELRLDLRFGRLDLG